MNEDLTTIELLFRLRDLGLMVIDLLGILKVGGAYVPLDPNFTRDLLELMLEDSGAPILLTQSDLSENLSE